MFATIASIMLSLRLIFPAVEGLASYYNVASSSALTASGEPMVDEAFTCAMPDGEFGAYYRVSAENGRTVVCRLNDRGPYVEGRVIDLSEAAMRELGGIDSGLLRVRVELLPPSALPDLVGAGG